MVDAPTLDVPMELGLELMAVIYSDFLDPERELFDIVIDEFLSVGLCVFVVDLERPDWEQVALLFSDLDNQVTGQGYERRYLFRSTSSRWQLTS